MSRRIVKRPVPRWVRLSVTLLVTALLLSAAALATIGVCWVCCPFPRQKLAWTRSVRLTDRRGVPIAELVTPDETWRHPVPLAEMSPWLVKATVAAEDKRFFDHPGVDALAAGRAAVQNMVHRQVVSGASTLTMQVCRMMDDRDRTFRAKAVESLRALQLEQLMDKRAIVETYLNMAPYGRNFRGVEAASRGWFGKPCSQLSLAEAALLAGLPQSPALYRLDKHPERAVARRQVVLGRMLALGMIDREDYDQAVDAPVRIVPTPHRNTEATAFAFKALARRSAGGRTTLDLTMQRRVRQMTVDHLATLPAGTHAAVVVIDIAEGALRVMAVCGPGDPSDRYVNTATAWRSPGSALKPFVYLAAFQAGRLSPEAAVYDVPIDRDGWQPENFDRTHAGRLTAGDALRRSLNVPAVLVAEGVGLARCVGAMQSAGLSFRGRPGANAGLSLAVGGQEVRLVDLVQAYATLGRDGRRIEVRLFEDEPVQSVEALEATACRTIGHVLSCRHRAPRGIDDVLAADVPWFAWKTGTSSGRRDAWAVGHNRRYAVGVWVGRTRGTGHEAYVGAAVAEPLLARIFCLDTLRQDVDPDPAEPIRVIRPLPTPRQVAEGNIIAAPREGAVFTALSGQAVVRPKAQLPDGQATWFLNDRPLPGALPNRLALSPGRYELRCVVEGVAVDSVRFAIR